MHKLGLIALLSFGVAGAQDPLPEPKRYDLRAQYRYVAGAKLRVTERQALKQEVRVRSRTKVLERDAFSEGVEQTYVLEVLEVNEKGDLLRAVRSYESLRMLDGDTAIPVEGIRILCVLKDESMHYTPEQGVELPAELQAVLNEAGDGSAPDPTENLGSMFPTDPIAVGGSWTCDPKPMAESLGLNAEFLEPASKVAGTLQAAKSVSDTLTQLTSHVDVELRVTSFQGLQGKEPFVFDLKCDLSLPAGGTDPGLTVSLKGVVTGRAPSPANDGTVLELDLTLDMSLKREALP